MCGIVGIYNYGVKGVIDEEELIAIRDLMTKRGPDGKGQWTSTDKKVWLGHRRLEIIGLGDQGIQPMVLEDRCLGGSGKIAISFNGEIYNFKELRRSLIDEGHKFRTSTDTEVLLHLYEKYGEDFIQMLRGMFAFVIYDEHNMKFVLCRDHFGIKPLYFSSDNNSVRVASQAKALLSSSNVSNKTSEAALAGLLVFGHIPDPLTAWEMIKAVPAGCIVTFDRNGGQKLKRYFSLPAQIREAEKNVLENPSDMNTTSVLKDSVRAHLVSDVEVGVFLSSGIDSSSILGVASEIHPNIQAVTLGLKEFVGLDSDEVPLAKEVASFYGAEHLIELVGEDDFNNCLPKMLEDMDQPSIDGLNTWMVARATKHANLKVALSGIGGDEFFGGYSTFKRVPNLYNRFKRLSQIGLLNRASEQFRSQISSYINPKAAGLIEYGNSLERMWLLNRSVQGPWEINNVIGRERAENALNELGIDLLLNEATVSLETDIGKVAALEAGLYMKNQLLRDADWAGMGHSLEIRVPLVDSISVGMFLDHLISDWNSVNPKISLVNSPNPQLPDYIAKRKKTGFSLPMAQWALNQKDHDSWKKVSSLTGNKCSWARRWSYVVADSFGMI